MFEKLKEYALYIILWLIALWALAYTYINVSNQQKWTEIHEANLDAIVNSLAKSDKLKKNSTVADNLLQANWWRTIWKYTIDSDKVSYVVGETYSDIFDNKKMIDISSDMSDVEEWKLRTILIAQPATQVNWEDINSINLNSDQSITIWENTISKDNINQVADELKWYNVWAIWFWLFENEKEAKDFRDTYFSSYETYEIWETWQYVILTEYNTTWWDSTTPTPKLNSVANWWESWWSWSETCNEYICLDSNWVTIKAKESTNCWQEYEFQWNTYYVVCNLNQLKSLLSSWTYEPNRLITSKLTSLYRAIFDNPSFNSDISNWDTSNVTDMRDMFFWSSNFNQNIWYWDVSNVNTFWRMFFWATEFNNWWSDSIKNWNTWNVTSMYRMFWNASSFNQPLNNWNTSNVDDTRWFDNWASSWESHNKPIFN